MGMKKPSSLKTAFWRFLFMLLGGLFGAVAVPFLLVTVSTTLGLTTYGDYSEIRANELVPILAATPDLSDVQIPMGIEYALLDKNYQLRDTNLPCLEKFFCSYCSDKGSRSNSDFICIYAIYVL